MASEIPKRIWVGIDEDTNEKRWFSIRGMGVEYMRASDVLDLLAAAEAVVTAYDARGDMPAAITALEEVIRQYGRCPPHSCDEMIKAAIGEERERCASYVARHNIAFSYAKNIAEGIRRGEE